MILTKIEFRIEYSRYLQIKNNIQRVEKGSYLLPETVMSFRIDIFQPEGKNTPLNRVGTVTLLSHPFPYPSYDKDFFYHLRFLV